MNVPPAAAPPVVALSFDVHAMNSAMGRSDRKDDLRMGGCGGGTSDDNGSTPPGPGVVRVVDDERPGTGTQIVVEGKSRSVGILEVTHGRLEGGPGFVDRGSAAQSLGEGRRRGESGLRRETELGEAALVVVDENR